MSTHKAGEHSSDDLKSKPDVGTSWVTNSYLMGWLTIIGFVLGIWGIYISLNSDKVTKPTFKILSDYALTDNGNTSKIKVYYDSTEVLNVRTVTVAIWNAGNAFLDKNNISKDYPIAISCSKAVKILDFKTIKTTRPQLSFDSTICGCNGSIRGTPVDSTDKNSDYVLLKIKGDEGFEKNDGATFQILYTSPAKNCSWGVGARIKGTPEGFKVALNDLYPYKVVANFWSFMFTLLVIHVSGITIGKSYYTRTMKTILLLVVLVFFALSLHYYMNSIYPYRDNFIDIPELLVTNK